jgi:hypothetical protein
MTLLQRYEELLDRLLAELKENYRRKLVACAVFGSVGRGTHGVEETTPTLCGGPRSWSSRR